MISPTDKLTKALLLLAVAVEEQDYTLRSIELNEPKPKPAVRQIASIFGVSINAHRD